MSTTAMDRNTEIRKLRPAELYTLGQILDTSDSWKQLMAIVLKEGTEDVPKFNTEHFAIIERAVHQQKRMAAEIFLEEWGTMGRQRPTLQSTLTLLVKAELFRAADFIAVDLLKEAPPRRPACGPAAQVDTSDEAIAKLLQKDTEKRMQSKNTLECNLDNIAYPSDLSANNALNNQNVESNFDHRDMSTLTLAEQNRGSASTNLMQFSADSARSSTNTATTTLNSDLIKFSANIQQQSCTEDKPSRNLRNDNISPKQNTDKEQDRCLPTSLHGNINLLQRRPDIVCYPPIPEHPNSERPNINDRNIDDSYSSKGQEHRTNTYSESNHFYAQSLRSKYELDTSELPAVVAELERNPTPQGQELSTQELPQFVAELARLKPNQSSRSITSYEQFHSSSVATDCSAYSAGFPNFDVIKPESIPVCVDSFERSQENNEMLTGELPQFVADLSRKAGDASSKISNEFDSSRSSNTPDVGLRSADVRSIERYSLPKVESREGFYEQNVALTSQELPVVVLECNNVRSESDERQQEVVYSDLPQFVAEL